MELADPNCICMSQLQMLLGSPAAGRSELFSVFRSTGSTTGD
jgi:hypothetical protein